MFRGDLGVKDDEIVKIGELHDEKADLIIDAHGKFVCPGFVDVNNHSDTFWRIFLNPELESLVYQGITTIVGGNCGTSLAPLVDARTIESIQKWTDLKNVTVDWLRTKEFFDFLENKKLSINFATLVGHATLRRGILKDESRSLSPKEIAFIEKLLKDSLEEGALGLSAGLVYSHAKAASTDELINLSKWVKKYNGVYATHIRGEQDDIIESLEEAVEIAQKSKVKLHISHLKAMGEKNWSKMDEALDIIDHAYENGVDVTFDVYPYTNTGSVLYTILPDWIAEGGKKMLVRRLKDPVTRAKVILEMKESDFDYSKIEIAISPLNKTLARKKISEIAASQEKSVEEAVVDILVASEGRVIGSMEVLSAKNVEKALLHPLSIVATNGAGYNVDHKETGEIAHPRSFGAFPKVIHEYVLNKKLLSWEGAIRKMSSLPAKKFGLQKRGALLEGNFADVLVLDPEKINGPASKENPYQYSSGVDFMLVNGKVIVGEGEYNGEMGGRIIRRN